MNEVQEYAELSAIAMFYQFKQMKAHNVYRKKETKTTEKEFNRVYNLWTESLKKIDIIQKEKKNDDKFWVDVDQYRYTHKDELINAGVTFNLN